MTAKIFDLDKKKVTPKSLFTNALKHTDGMKDVIMIATDNDDDMVLGHTPMDYLKIIGLLDVAKQDILDKMRA